LEGRPLPALNTLGEKEFFCTMSYSAVFFDFDELSSLTFLILFPI
jgi:hypothetical protein